MKSPVVHVVLVFFCLLTNAFHLHRTSMYRYDRNILHMAQETSILESKLVPRNDSYLEKAAIFSVSVLLTTITPKPKVALLKVGFSYSNFVNVTKVKYLSSIMLIFSQRTCIPAVTKRAEPRRYQTRHSFSFVKSPSTIYS